MNLVNGLIWTCVIVSLGAIALVGFALWIRSNDETADLPEHNDAKALVDAADLRANARRVIQQKLGINDLETIVLTRREALLLFEAIESPMQQAGGASC